MDKGVVALDPTNRIKSLSDQASSVHVDPSISCVKYFRSSLEMLRMAKVYALEGNLETAFVLYNKFLSLVVEKVTAHPGYKAVDVTYKKNSKKNCAEAFAAAEDIKSQLKKRYEADFQAHLASEAIRLQQLKEAEDQRLAEERVKLAEQQAKQEMELKHRLKLASEEEDERYALFLQRELQKDASNDVHPAPSAPPSVPLYEQPPSLSGVVPNIPPPAYSPVHVPSTAGISKPLPQTPSKAESERKPVPAVDRSLKPAHFTQNDSETTNNKFGLKTVIVSPTLAGKFAQLAQANTSRNVETCGLLCGKLKQGAFLVTHVVIPKQHGTPDSCNMENEEEIFVVQDKYDLITLGWIHTHPTQTAFLSSVDLHTHSPYQLLMPEAIAIVVSPKFNETGIFHLTPQYGLDFVANCTRSGFHPHPKEPPLFQECEHVKMDPSSEAVIVDLR